MLFLNRGEFIYFLRSLIYICQLSGFMVILEVKIYLLEFNKSII